jgi:chromosome segregation ATPase
MGRITFTADEQQERTIDDAQEQHNLDSTAAAVRHCIDGYAELQQQVDELNAEIDTLNRDIDSLKTELDDERQERRMVLSLWMGDDVDAEQLEAAEHIDADSVDAATADDDDDDLDSPPVDAGLSGRIRWLLFGSSDE